MVRISTPSAPRLGGIWVALYRIFYGALWLYQAILGDIRAWPVAILLLLGLFTPLGALVGVYLTLSYYAHSGSPAPPNTSPYLWSWGPLAPMYWLVSISLLTLLLARAGRFWGLDGWVAHHFGKDAG